MFGMKSVRQAIIEETYHNTVRPTNGHLHLHRGKEENLKNHNNIYDEGEPVYSTTLKNLK